MPTPYQQHHLHPRTRTTNLNLLLHRQQPPSRMNSHHRSGRRADHPAIDPRLPRRRQHLHHKWLQPLPNPMVMSFLSLKPRKHYPSACPQIQRFRRRPRRRHHHRPSHHGSSSAQVLLQGDFHQQGLDFITEAEEPSHFTTQRKTTLDLPPPMRNRIFPKPGQGWATVRQSETPSQQQQEDLYRNTQGPPGNATQRFDSRRA